MSAVTTDAPAAATEPVVPEPDVTTPAPVVEEAAVPAEPAKPEQKAPAKSTGRAPAKRKATDLSNDEIAEMVKMRESGLLLLEIADKFHLDKNVAGQVLKDHARPTTSKAKGKSGPARQPKDNTATSTLDWDGLVASIRGLDGVWIAWRRGTYCMVRATKGTTGVPAGTVIAKTKTPWATVCEHGTVHGTGKGGSAEQAGKDRATWCTSCKDGKPAKVAKKDGSAKPATTKAEAKTSSTKTPPAKKATPATVAKGAQSRASKNVERAAARTEGKVAA